MCQRCRIFIVQDLHAALHEHTKRVVIHRCSKLFHHLQVLAKCYGICVQTWRLLRFSPVCRCRSPGRAAQDRTDLSTLGKVAFLQQPASYFPIQRISLNRLPRVCFFFSSLYWSSGTSKATLWIHTHTGHDRPAACIQLHLHYILRSHQPSTLLNERTSRSTLHQVVIVCMRLAFARRLACPIQKVTPSSCTIPFPVEFVAQQPTRPKHPGVSRQVLGTLPSKRLTRISINRRPASVVFRYFLPLLLLQYQNN